MVSGALTSTNHQEGIESCPQLNSLQVASLSITEVAQHSMVLYKLHATTDVCTGNKDRCQNCKSVCSVSTSSLYIEFHPALRVVHGSVNLCMTPLPSSGTLISADTVL